MPSIYYIYIDISTPDFPGISRLPKDGGYSTLMLSPESHPHLRLDECVISVPKVNPGDTVFWHCDVVHAVEKEHTGSGDSAGKHLSSLSDFSSLLELTLWGKLIFFFK
jgi:hypothetical protein